MKTETHSFYSEGIRLAGLVHLPDDIQPGERRSAMLICSGGQGLKEWVPARWWPYFVAAGYVCMAFDYRGFGTSEGERGQMFPQREAQDVRAAVAFLQQHPSVDPHSIGAVGWGMGGAVVIEAAAYDDSISSVCCAAGFGWGARAHRDNCSLQAWIDRQDELAQDRVRRAVDGKSKMVPWYQALTPGRSENPMTRPSNQFRKDISALGQKPVPELSLATCEAIYDFRPELLAARISPRPLLVVHGTRDRLYHPDEARSIYDHALEPKTLMWIEGGDHLDWIQPDSPLSKPGIGRVVGWFVEQMPPYPIAVTHVPAAMFAR